MAFNKISLEVYVLGKKNVLCLKQIIIDTVEVNKKICHLNKREIIYDLVPQCRGLFLPVICMKHNSIFKKKTSKSEKNINIMYEI